MKIRTIITFPIVFLMFSCLVFADTRNFQSLLKEYSPSVAHVMVILGHGKERIGSAFIADQNGTLITNAHVIKNAKSVWARFPNGKSYECKLVATDPVHDLAAIRLIGLNKRLKSIPIPSQNNSRPDQLEEILVIGSPSGLSSTPHIGRFTNSVNSSQVRDSAGKRVFQNNFTVYQLNVDVTHGSSGGPVINKQGQIIGALTAGIDHGNVGIAFCVPHSVIRSLPLNRQPRAFSSQSGQYRLGEISDTQLAYQSQNTIQRQTSNYELNFRSNQWGFVNPKFISQYLDDVRKTSQLVPYNLFRQIAQRNRLIHIVNSTFRFRVITPEKYRMEERVDEHNKTYTAKFIDPGRKKVRIMIQRIQRPKPHERIRILDKYGMKFVNQGLRLHVVPPNSAIRANDVYLGPLSDPSPRTSMMSGTVKFWRQYIASPVYDRAYFVMCGINDDLFVTIFMEYRPSQTTNRLPRDFLERLFVASTLSFI